MKKAVLTGAAGHIGFNVAQQLLQKDYQLTLLVRSINTNIIELQNQGATIVQCNLFQPETYQQYLSNIDVLFHLAAENTTAMANAASVMSNSIDLTKTILQSSLKQGVPTVIYTSSVVVIGRSTDKNKLLNESDVTTTAESPYVEGKLQAEQFVSTFIQENNIDVRRVYPSWVVGSGDAKLTPPHKVIKDFMTKGQPFYFDGGVSIADVKDVAYGHIAAYEKGEKNGTYILSGDNITFKELYQILSSYSHQKMPKLKMPKWFIFMAAWVLQKALKLIGKESPISPEYVQTVVGNYSWYDSSKAQKDLGFKVTKANDSLKPVVQDSYKRMAGTFLLGKKTNTLPALTSSPNNDILLITGVPGWLGNRMIDIMINGDRFGNYRSNRKVRVLVEPRFKAYINLPSNYEIVYGDITNADDMLRITKDVKTVFHLAGAIYPKNIDVLYKVNEQGTKNLVDACIANSVDRFIYMSTDSTCGHGTKAQPIFDENTIATPYKNYGKSKYAGEKYVLDKTAEGKIKGTSLRGFWFFGPFAPERQLNFVNMFYWPRQIVFGNGKNLRSISHVDNIISAFFEAENNEKAIGNWYWIGNDQPFLTVDDIYQAIANALGVSYKPLYVPKFVCRILEKFDTILGKFNYLHPTIHAAGKFDYDIAGTIDKAKADFGYNPEVTLEDAAEELAK